MAEKVTNYSWSTRSKNVRDTTHPDMRKIIDEALKNGVIKKRKERGKMLIGLVIFFSLELGFDQKIKLLWTNFRFCDSLFKSIKYKGRLTNMYLGFISIGFV